MKASLPLIAALLVSLFLCCPSSSPSETPAATPTAEPPAPTEVAVTPTPVATPTPALLTVEDGRTQISDGKNLFTVVVLYEIPLDVAAALAKGQAVEGEGTVREVDTTLTLAVWIDVGEIR